MIIPTSSKGKDGRAAYPVTLVRLQPSGQFLPSSSNGKDGRLVKLVMCGSNPTGGTFHRGRSAKMVQLPEAIVVGGYPADRGEVGSRMAAYGWRVREHRLAGATGDDYQRLPKGVKLVVVLRDTLDEKQYNRAHTMADIGKVPVVKWDVDRYRFRNRLERLGLLYEDLAKAAAQPPAPAGVIEASLGPRQEIVNGTPVPPELQVEWRVKSPIDDLRSVAELMKAELETNPLFSGITVQVNADGTTTVTPVARSFTLGTPSTVDRLVNKTLVAPEMYGAPPPEPPRPVFQPIQPVYQPIAPKMEPKPKLNKRGRKMPPPMDMRCRYPNCTAQSRGPRYQFHCAAHSNIPEREKKVNMAAYKKEHHAPH